MGLCVLLRFLELLYYTSHGSCAERARRAKKRRASFAKLEYASSTHAFRRGIIFRVEIVLFWHARLLTLVQKSYV